MYVGLGLSLCHSYKWIYTGTNFVVLLILLEEFAFLEISTIDVVGLM